MGPPVTIPVNKLNILYIIKLITTYTKLLKRNLRVYFGHDRLTVSPMLSRAAWSHSCCVAGTTPGDLGVIICFVTRNLFVTTALMSLIQ